MAFRGEISEDVAEAGGLYQVTRESPIEPDELLRHLESIGIDLEGFDLLGRDPMTERPTAYKRFGHRERRRLQA